MLEISFIWSEVYFARLWVEWYGLVNELIYAVFWIDGEFFFYGFISGWKVFLNFK